MPSFWCCENSVWRVIIVHGRFFFISLWTSVKMSNEFPKYFFMIFCIHWLHFWFFFSGRGTSQTSYCPVIGQCRILLHGPVGIVCRSQFSQPQSLGNYSGFGQKRHLCGRAFRLFTNGNGADPIHASEIG